MIEKLRIRNFQSHKNTSLELHKGVNIIVGDSDQGKTAILRALRFAVWNQPLGDRFRSRWGGDTEVEVVTSGHTISRIKTNSENKYVLDNDVVFKALRTDVPDEIKTVLNLKDINFQYQLDGHYLLSRTSGEVAQHFNKVAHLEAIDSSRKKIQSEFNKNKTELELKKKDYEEKEAELEKYKYLEKAEMDLEVLEQLERDKLNIVRTISKLQSLVKESFEIKKEIRKHKQFIYKEKQVDKIIKLIKDKSELEQLYKKLQSLKHQWKETTEEISISEKTVELEIPVNELLKLHESYKQKEADLSNLIRKLTNYKATLNKVKETQGKLAKLDNLWHTSFPDVCPLCGTDLKKSNTTSTWHRTESEELDDLKHGLSFGMK